MRPVGKWIPELRASTPVQQAARLALQDRLADLPRLLKRASGGNSDSAATIRRVHQLRVATRRAGAAIQVFEDVLEPKRVRRWKRWLRRMRRAAGTIRDLDIAAQHLVAEGKSRKGSEASAARRWAADAAAERAAEAPRLKKLAEKLTPDRLERAAAKLIAGIDAGEVAENSAAAFARRVLRRELDDVKAAAASDLAGNIECVHQLRIAIKRLRYGMELFGHSFDDSFRRVLYAELMALQDRLGGLNDLAGMAVFSSHAARRDRPKQRKKGRGAARVAPGARPSVGGERLARRFAQRLSAEQATFVRAWNEFKPDGYFDRFEQAIRPAFVAHTVIEPKSPASRSRRATTPSLNGTAGHAPLGADRTRIAAIDVGTNSLRLIIAEASADGSYRVLDDEKEVTRLGRGLHASGRLDPAAIEHSVAAIARMKSIAEGYGASRIRVVGTAAAREAENAEDLALAIAEATGLTLEIIPAEQEALLAYRSAARAFDLSTIASAVVDIGGGSTEVVLSIGGEAAAARVRASIAAAGTSAPTDLSASLIGQRAGRGGMIERLYTIPLGAVRLTERFGGAEACAGPRFDEMCRFVKRVVKQHIGRAPVAPQLLIGTGGTFTTLGAMAVQRELGTADAALFSGVVQGHDVPRAEVRHLIEYLRKLPVDRRARVPGLSSDRADIIVAGLVIVDAVLKRLDVNRARVHEGGIRDGLLLSMIGQDAARPSEPPAAADPIASARRFARACAYEEPHSLHVARLALQIFDQIEPRLPLPADSPTDLGRLRQILEAAAILHDVGYLINYAAHHKHSYHLIVHADLPAWTSREVHLIANIARYHRCAAPTRKHAAFAMLTRPERKLVRLLASILRIADGLDRTHVQRVESVQVQIRRDAAFFEISSPEEPSVDLWGGARKSRLFERMFGLIPHFEWRVGIPAPEVPGKGRLVTA